MPGTLDAVAPLRRRIAEREPADSAKPTSDDETPRRPQLDEKQAAAIRDALSAKADDEIPCPARSAPVRSRAHAGSRLESHRQSRRRHLHREKIAAGRLGHQSRRRFRAQRHGQRPAVPALSGAPKNTGAAWANVQVPGVASIDARVGAGSEPNKIGIEPHAADRRAMASLTLQGSYAVTETSSAAPAGRRPPMPRGLEQRPSGASLTSLRPAPRSASARAARAPTTSPTTSSAPSRSCSTSSTSPPR